MTIPMHQDSMRYIKGSSSEGIYTYAKYGNFTFPAAISLKFNVEPVYDSSNRLPKWWKHTFTIETVIDPTMAPMSDSAGLYPGDFNMGQIRRILGTPGLDLVFWNLGVGQNQRMDYNHKSETGADAFGEPDSTLDDMKQDPIDGTPSSNNYSFYVSAKKDLDFGPKPELLVCEPVGSARVWRIVWTVSCCLPICCVAYDGETFTLCNTPEHLNDDLYVQDNGPFNGQFPKLTEFNYSLSWQIDTQRFTTFTIVGSVEFAGTLIRDPDENNISEYTATVINTKNVMESLGKFFPLRKKFRRTMQYDLSRDKRKLEFRFTDAEIPSVNPYYTGLDDMQFTQSISGNPLGGKWRLTFDAAMTMQPGISKFHGYLAFVSVIRVRLEELLKAESTLREEARLNASTFKHIYLPISFSIDEEIFEQTVRFSYAMDVFVGLQNIMFATGFFRQFNRDALSWDAHYQTSSTNPKNVTHAGNANIKTQQNEQLANVCSNRSPVAPSQEKSMSSVLDQYTDVPDQVSYYPLFTPTCPEPDSSILDYKNTFSVAVNGKIVPQVPTGMIKKQYASDLNQRAKSPPAEGQASDPPEKYIRRNHNKVEIDENANRQIALDNNKYTYSSGILAAMAQLPGEPLISPGGISADQIPPTDTCVTYQVNGPSEIEITMEGYLISLCHPVIAPSLMTVKTIPQGQVEGENPNVNPRDERPVLKSSSVDGPYVVESRTEVPVLGYRWSNTYSVSGVPVGPINLLINNNTYEGLLSSTLNMPKPFGNADGLGLGTDAPWGDAPGTDYKQYLPGTVDPIDPPTLS